jgi:hypothetical protein
MTPITTSWKSTGNKNQVQQMDVWSHDRADHLERLKRLDGMKEKNKATGGVWKVTGNLRFPLDKTYHGCP